MTPARVVRGLELITKFLDEQGIQYEVVSHEETVTAVDLAQAAGVEADAVAKTIALRDDGRWRLAVLPASRRLHLGRARAALGAGSSLRFASEEEMEAELDVFDVGAIAPLVDLVNATEVIDERLLDREQILFSGGDHTHGVLIDPDDLLQITQPKVADICTEEWPG